MNQTPQTPPPTKTPRKRTTINPMPDGLDFLEVVSLLEILTEAATGLSEIEASANGKLLELIGQYKTEYARFQLAATTAETGLESLCRKHPEWFVSAKSITTPFGKVSFHRSTKLIIKDEEATVRLIQARAQLSLSARAVKGTGEVFEAETYIKTVQIPNLEALENLDDRELAEFMVTRERKDNFSASPAKVDFGKAVTEAAKTATN